MLKFFVGSDISTFYPISDNDEMQTIKNTVSFIKRTNFDKNIDFFQVGDINFTISQYNQIYFIVQATNLSKRLMQYIANSLKNIAIFLFGQDFQNYMLDNISLSYQTVYTNYVSAFLDLINSNPRYLAGIIPHSHGYFKNCQFLVRKLPPSGIPAALEFVECIIFNENEIIGRFSKDINSTLDCFDMLMLSIFHQVEFPEKGNPDRNLIEVNYVTNSEPSPVHYRAGFLKVNGKLQRCSIAAVRLGLNSSFSSLFITLNPTEYEKRDFAMNILGLVSAAVSDMIVKITPFAFPLPPDVVGFMVVNRSTGETFEVNQAKNERTLNVVDNLFKNLFKRSFEAIPRGITTLLWNDSYFDFCYNILFRKSSGTIVPNGFDAFEMFEKNVFYKQIINIIFGPRANIDFIEVYSIFMSTHSQHEVVVLSREMGEKIIAKMPFREGPTLTPKHQRSVSASKMFNLDSPKMMKSESATFKTRPKKE